MGSQRVWHDLPTKQQYFKLTIFSFIHLFTFSYASLPFIIMLSSGVIFLWLVKSLKYILNTLKKKNRCLSLSSVWCCTMFYIRVNRGSLVNILGFMISLAVTQLCHHCLQAAIDVHKQTVMAVFQSKFIYRNRQEAIFGQWAEVWWSLFCIHFHVRDVLAMRLE